MRISDWSSDVCSSDLSGGRMAFDSVSLGDLPLHRRARMGIGRTFQIPQPLHELTVRENLVVAQRFATGRVDPERIEQVLDFTNLAGRADSNVASELAMTERKDLDIANALSTDPQSMRRQQGRENICKYD